MDKIEYSQTGVLPHPLNQDNQEKFNQNQDESDEDDNSLCPFFKTLVIDNKLEERDEALRDLQIFVGKNKPSYKLLEDELMLFVRKYHESLAKPGERWLKVLVSRLLDLYETARKKGMNPLTIKIFLRANQRLKFEFPNEFNEEIKEIALNFWKLVDGENLNHFLHTFEIQEKINPRDVVPNINELLAQKKLKEAVFYISTLDLQDEFNILEIIPVLVHQSKADLAALIVKKNVALQKELVREMSTNKLASKAADYVKQFKLDPNLFPDLIERLQKNCLRYYVNTDNWMKVEEKFSGVKHVLGYYVEDLVYKQELDLALSIIQRNNLWNEGHIKKPDTIEELSPYFTVPPTKTFTYVPNILFTMDAFGPTEEAIGDAPPGTYWHLRDCGIDVDKDIVWIDDCTTEVFDLAAKDILSSKAVGMDSEFRMSMTKFDRPGTALLQLATNNKIYLIDSLKLSTEPKYNTLIKDLFTDPKILKIGHTLTADLEILKNGQVDGSELIIRNHLDLPRVFKGLYPDLRQSSLAYICEYITKKPMSKYEQISNWNTRPLRKAQLHYAAMDAIILLKIYQEMEKLLTEIGEDIIRYIDSSIGSAIVGSKKTKLMVDDEVEEIPKDETEGVDFPDEATEKESFKPTNKPYRPKNKNKNKEEVKKEDKPVNKPKEKPIQFYAAPEYSNFYSDPENIKFLIDNMTFKLAKYLRNVGFDAEFLPEKNHDELTQLAKAEKRVIITRDEKYFNRRIGVPCFYLTAKKTSDQFKDVITKFNLKVDKGNFLSRCVKCNHQGLNIITPEEAKAQLQWKNEEDYAKYDTFWQCDKCKQVYWEGGTFKRAQVRFQEFASSDEEAEENQALEGTTQFAGVDIENFDFE